MIDPYRHMATTTGYTKWQKKNKGCQKKLNDQDERRIVRTLKTFRNEQPLFSGNKISAISLQGHLFTEHTACF